MRDLWGTISRDAQHGTIDMRRTYPTDLDDLWDAITTPERAARWLGEVSGNLQEGGEYRIEFEPGDPTQVNFGVIERCDPPSALRVTWQAPDEAVASVVEVTLAPVAGGTELHLVHQGLSHGSDAGHAAGWQVHLGMLEESLSQEVVEDSWDAWAPLRDSYLELIERPSAVSDVQPREGSHHS